MRIISGKYRGKKLVFPESTKTRPTKDRIRESIFNVLNHASWADNCLKDAIVLDVFAGTGAFGLESLSRGAKQSTFIENDTQALKACKTNIIATDCNDISSIIQRSVFDIGIRPKNTKKATLVFLDPPYGNTLGEKALDYLLKQEWLSDDVIIVLETEKEATDEALPNQFIEEDNKVYGIAKIRFLTLQK